MTRGWILRKSLRDQRSQIVGFGLALAVIAALDVLTWPSIRDASQNFDIPASLQAVLGTDLSIATGAGNLSVRFFSWTIVLLIVFAVTQGVAAVGGEDAAGTLELLLAQPLSRRRLVVEKSAAACLGAGAIVLICFAGFVVTLPMVAIDVTVGDVALGVANMLPITLLFFALSLWLGALLPTRGAATGCVIALATASYVANTLAQGIGGLSGLRYASPFWYYGAGRPLVDGIGWWHAGLLLAVAAVCGALAVVAAERREVGAEGGERDVMRALRRRVRTT